VPLTIILSLMSLLLAVGDIPFLGLPCPCDTNKPASALWDGHTAKPFLERFSRQCLSRWLAEDSGHGDFSEYHVRFHYSRRALEKCPCGRIASRGHFFPCPLATFNNPLASRLNPRAFWFSSTIHVQGLPDRALGPGLGCRHGAPYPNIETPPLPPPYAITVPQGY